MGKLRGYIGKPREMITCECGNTVLKSSFNRHVKTRGCMAALNRRRAKEKGWIEVSRNYASVLAAAGVPHDVVLVQYKKPVYGRTETNMYAATAPVWAASILHTVLAHGWVRDNAERDAAVAALVRLKDDPAARVALALEAQIQSSSWNKSLIEIHGAALEQAKEELAKQEQQKG